MLLTEERLLYLVRSVTCDTVDDRHKGEGRLITVELEKFHLIGCYVPNSGQALDRLDYRVNDWDPFLRDYMTTLAVSKPVILAGDLNVGHLDIDIHNPGAKHISKQAGLTPQERQSFSLLLEKDFKDAFRFFYPGLEKMDFFPDMKLADCYFLMHV